MYQLPHNDDWGDSNPIFRFLSARAIFFVDYFCENHQNKGVDTLFRLGGERYFLRLYGEKSKNSPNPGGDRRDLGNVLICSTYSRYM